MSKVAPVTAVFLIRSMAARRHVLGADHSPNRQRDAELLAPGVEPVTEDGRGQPGVDESRCDDVDANRGEFEREAPGQGRHGGGAG